MRRNGQTSRLDDGSRSIGSWCRNTRGILCVLRRSDNPESNDRTVRGNGLPRLAHESGVIFISSLHEMSRLRTLRLVDGTPSRVAVP